LLLQWRTLVFNGASFVPKGFRATLNLDLLLVDNLLPETGLPLLQEVLALFMTADYLVLVELPRRMCCIRKLLLLNHLLTVENWTRSFPSADYLNDLLLGLCRLIRFRR